MMVLLYLNLSFSGTGVSSFKCVPSNDVLVMAI